VVIQKLTGIAVVVTLLWCVFVLREARLLIAAKPISTPLGRIRLLALAVFSTAPVIWNIGLSLGYLDAIVLSLGLAVVASGDRVSPLGAALLAGLAIAVHEMAAILVAPLLLILAFDPRFPSGFSGRRAAQVSVALVALAAMTVWLSGHAPSPELERQLLADPWLEPYWVHLLVDLQRQKLETSFLILWRAPGYARDLARNAILYLPATLAVLSVGLVQIWSLVISTKAKLLWTAAYAVASVSQLASVLIAFDFSRLFALTNAQAFLAYCLLNRRLAGREVRPARATVAALGAVCVAVAVADGLMKLKFTYLPPMPLWWPAGWDRWMLDPLELAANAVLGPPAGH
jgi:hypothetical protein